MIPMDLHTHTVASGHGTCQTIADLARAARQKGMSVLGISDHGPATPGSCRESYFRSLKIAPGKRAGIKLLYGAEANILDESGRLDLCSETMAGLDYVIASLHSQTFSPADSAKNRSQFSAADLTETERNTQALLSAMKNPYVRIIGHPDDVNFPIDACRVVQAAIENHVILEVNEASLSPQGYRGDTKNNMSALLTLCLRYRHPILLSSDSHGSLGIGEASRSLALVREIGFPYELILNYLPPERFLQFR